MTPEDEKLSLLTAKVVSYGLAAIFLTVVLGVMLLIATGIASLFWLMFRFVTP